MTAESKTALYLNPPRQEAFGFIEKTPQTCGSISGNEGLYFHTRGASACISPPLIITTGSCPCSSGPKGFQCPSCPHAAFSGELRRQKVGTSRAGQGRADNIGGRGSTHIRPSRNVSADGAGQGAQTGKKEPSLPPPSPSPRPAASSSGRPLTLRNPSGASAGGDLHSQKVQVRLRPTLRAEL